MVHRSCSWLKCGPYVWQLKLRLYVIIWLKRDPSMAMPSFPVATSLPGGSGEHGGWATGDRAEDTDGGSLFPHGLGRNVGD